MEPMAVVIRAATQADLHDILTIYEYYVTNTVVSFLVKQPPIEYIQSRYDAAVERGLPYLVAVETGSAGSSSTIVGFTYASAFRGFMLGYGHSVEVTVFCHQAYRNRGVGGRMMRQLFAHLREKKHVSREAGHEDEPREFEVKQVLAIMALDEAVAEDGRAVREWYVKQGFEEVGHLRKVGFKQDRWYGFQELVEEKKC